MSPPEPRGRPLPIPAAASFAGVLALLLLVWWPVTHHALVWDDVGLIQKKLSVVHLDWLAMVRMGLWEDVPNAGEISAFFRPLVVLSFGIDRALAAGNPTFVHLHSLAWHAANVALAMAACRKLGAWGMAGAAAWVGLHPLVVEPVAFAAARNDLMATTFVCLALLAAERGRWRWVAAATALAALTKEAAFALPAMIFCQTAFRQESGKRAVAASAVGVGLAVALRAACHVGWPTAGADSMMAVAEKLGHSTVTLAAWLGWPMPASATVNLFTALPLASRLLGVGATGLGVLGVWRSAPTQRWRLAAALLALLTCAPAVLETGKIAARYAYLPLVLLAPALAEAAVVALGSDTRRLGALTVVAALAGAIGVRVRLGEWQDETSLFTAAAARTPDALSFRLLAEATRRTGDRPRAFSLFNAAIAYPDGPETACVPAAKTAWSGSIEASRQHFRDLGGPQHPCRAIAGVDDQLLWAAASHGAWPLVPELLANQVKADDTGRSQAVRAAMRLNDGDWEALMIGSLHHKAGMAAYMDAAYGVALATSTPPPTTPSASPPSASARDPE